MNTDETRPRHRNEDQMVGIVVAIGLALLMLVIAILFIVRAMSPDTFRNNRGAAMAPTVLKPEDLPKFGARFTDVAEESGVTAIQASGATGQRFLPETMGSGVTLADLDDDGDEDMLLLSYGSTPTLYRNDSPPGGPIRFTDVTGGSGLADLRSTTTASASDLDGDGDLDLYVGRLGPDLVMHNTGDMQFQEVEELGDGWTTAVGIIDTDGNGSKEIIVASYVQWSPMIDLEVDYTLDGIGRAYGPPTGFAGTDLAYYVRDEAGRYVDESSQRGLHVRHSDTNVPVMKALGLLLGDFDLNKKIDIAVANDTTPNRLFLQDDDGMFRESAVEKGFAYDVDGRSTGAMGIDGGFSGQGCLVAIGNFANEPSSLYTVQRWNNQIFTDDSAVSGVGPATRNSLTFGTVFMDADMDGELDLVQVNGHIEPDIAKVQGGQSYEQAGQIFRGTGGTPAFFEVPAGDLGDLAEPIVGRAAAVADLDGDGDLDLVVTRIDGVPRVLRNDLDHTNIRVFTLRLVDKNGAPAGAGARVKFAVQNQQVWSAPQERFISPVHSYMSQSSPVLKFGIKPTDKINTVSIELPGEHRINVSGINDDELTVVVP